MQIPDTQKPRSDSSDMQMNVFIIGLGLMGGSLAKALCHKLNFNNITAIDKDRFSLEKALNDGVIAKGLDSLNDSIYDADIIFICTPVKQTMYYLGKLAPKLPASCIVTDVSSTKSQIMRHAESIGKQFCFIGGHPMTGTEKSGYANSMAHLFENAYYILTPYDSLPSDSLDKLIDIVKKIGGIPLIMSAAEHDGVTGSISHLPHVIAAALVNLIVNLDNGEGKILPLAAGGFRDITRIASSNPEVWENIITSNREQITFLLSKFGESLRDFDKHLNDCNKEAIYNFFNNAKHYRDSIPVKAPGLIRSLPQLIVDVQDKPGTIGRIATILGENNINIKNINVSNSREFEQGCLTILLQDTASINIAFDLLSDKGYKVYETK